MNYRLHIIIPTYNRYEKLRALISGLVGCIPDDVAVTVLDNHSTDERYVRDLPNWVANILIGEKAVKVIRRNANYAFEGNMIRCYEIAEAPWLWVIGDDDSVVENFEIGTLLTFLGDLDVNKVAGCVLSSNLGCASQEKGNLLHGLDVAIKKVRFSSLLFISTNIYNITLIRRYMRETVHASNTACPHVAALFMALNDGYSLAVSSLTLIQWNVSCDKDEIHGDIYTKGGGLALRVSKLMELPLKDKDKALLFQALARCYGSVDSYLCGAFQGAPESMLGRLRLMAPYVIDVMRFERRFASRVGVLLAVGVCSARVWLKPFFWLRKRVKKICPYRRRFPDIEY